MRRPMHAALAGALVTALAVSLATVPTPALADPDEGRPTTPPGIEVADDVPVADPLAEEATEALATAEDLLAGVEPAPQEGTETDTEDGGRGTGDTDGADGTEAGDATEPAREVTLALRDLVLLRDSLPADQQRRATQLLARPSSSGGDGYAEYSVDEAPKKCSKVVCVHRVASTDDAATSSFAKSVLQAASSVRNTYTGAGYRAPRSDKQAANNGGNAKPDIYLADIGDQNIYGYCVPEGSGSSDRFDYWSYCVLDNDFSPSQFPNNTPLENMRVTAAHEFFHAVQFGYDATEASWFLEATATWIEDEVYDGINDNVSYLQYGPMRRPAGILDERSSSVDLGIYGAWSFFRFLTERNPKADGGLPVLVRQMWRRADAKPGGTDETDLVAVRRAIEATGRDFGESFAAYAEANRHPRRSYDEGKANQYPSAVVAGKKRLSGAKRTLRRTGRFDHLTSRTFRVVPKRGLKSPKWRVRLVLDLPPTQRGSQAKVTVYRKNGTRAVSSVRLNGKGDRVTSRPFSARQVNAVEVHVVNASTRVRSCYTAYTYPTISCAGVATDDNLPFDVRATLFRKR